MPRAEDRLRLLQWTTRPPSARRLRRDGYEVLPYARLARAAAAARPRRRTRCSLANPAAAILDLFARHPRVAVLDAPCRTVEDLALLHGYVVEPAFRRGCSLLIGSERELESLAPQDFVDPDRRCPWTLERLRHLAGLYATSARISAPARVSRAGRWARLLSRHGDGPPPRRIARLDEQQSAAVCAGDGVVQVIAPAGSGKTTVLVERVRELLGRGTPAQRILCSTFNRDACREIDARLQKAGLAGIRVRSFHGLGLDVLRAEGRLRGGIGTLADGQWDALAAKAAAAEPQPAALDGAAAREAVSGFKLALMITPAQARERARDLGPRARAEACVYALYEQELRRRRMLDFDDLIGDSIALLQGDRGVRERWQARFERVLVDEYQDIEPAQAQLIALLAAPHDSLFCVGDEDQCIYAWRRAAVSRVLELDQIYPGLARYPLVRNYRCGSAITEASRRLIGHNRRRFRKPLLAGAAHRGEIVLWPQPVAAAGALCVARLLREDRDGTIAVLARTGSLLAEAAAAAGCTPGGAAGVEFCTVHGAKGREWDRVILFGADQGRFPLAQALRPTGAERGVDSGEGLEDERRLFYVAMTRARHRLDIVCSAHKPSRFLREAGVPAG